MLSGRKRHGKRNPPGPSDVDHVMDNIKGAIGNLKDELRVWSRC
jgi:hypothetical protein